MRRDEIVFALASINLRLERLADDERAEVEALCRRTYLGHVRGSDARRVRALAVRCGVALEWPDPPSWGEEVARQVASMRPTLPPGRRA